MFGRLRDGATVQIRRRQRLALERSNPLQPGQQQFSIESRLDRFPHMVVSAIVIARRIAEVALTSVRMTVARTLDSVAERSRPKAPDSPTATAWMSSSIVLLSAFTSRSSRSLGVIRAS
jgi:hypothetical protein